MTTAFQPRFARFHEAIKLRNTEENVTLREKREGVLRRMRDRGLRFEPFNQGSYAMGTGVIPVGSDYDIDVGIVFTGPSRPADPMPVKKQVFDAVNGHTPVVEWRRNCVRVQYTRSGEARNHVDLAVYWKDPRYSTLSLAVGKEHSSAQERQWQPSDPQGLVSRVTEHLQGEDRAQFRRVIRYLKRWKDVHFPVMGNAAPVGVGLTSAALRWFEAVRPWGTTTSADYDDLTATRNLVDRMRANVRTVWHEGTHADRLVVELPVAPGNDVFARMTNQQMCEFCQRLDQLSSWLEEARRSGSARPLGTAFGSDFPTT